ncbi:hypothetical protein P8605_23665 [Streptomyces sp. T-3]|nr:hypothetical protein [Streptomyces sp. T-3]
MGDCTSDAFPSGDQGVRLRQILAALTVPVAAATGDEAVITEVIVAEPGEKPAPSPGALLRLRSAGRRRGWRGRPVVGRRRRAARCGS